MRVVTRNIIFLVHRKMYKKCVISENFEIHGMIGYNGMYFKSYSLHDMYVIIYL